MTERDFYPSVQNWVKANVPIDGAVTLELKLTKTNRFYLKAMEPHQVPWLFSSKYKKVSYKIPDVGFDRKPCDLIFFSGAQAYIGIIFYVPRIKKNIYLLDVDTFINHFKDNVSITEEQIKDIAEFKGHL